MSGRSTISIPKIPELSCEPCFSALRLPVGGAFSDTDVTGLANRYNFTTNDFGAVWEHDIFKINYELGSDKESSEDVCTVGSSFESDSKVFEYVSWLSGVSSASDGRLWVITEDFPCSTDSSSDSAFIGAYANAAGGISARPSFIPSPTPSPRWKGVGGSGGGTEYRGGSLGRVISIDENTGMAKVRLLGFSTGVSGFVETDVVVDAYVL